MESVKIRLRKTGYQPMYKLFCINDNLLVVIYYYQLVRYRCCIGWKICLVPIKVMGRHRSVSIATRHGLDGPRIESRCGRDYPHPSRPVLRST